MAEPNERPVLIVAGDRNTLTAKAQAWALDQL